MVVLGAMGVSVLVASGDNGAADRNEYGEQMPCGYQPAFPASSPYITAVWACAGCGL